MPKNQTLFLFTSSFPYGNGETFLESEVPYLMKGFRNVVIIPTRSNMGYSHRKTNAKIVSPLLNNNKFKRFFFGLFRIHYLSIRFIFNMFFKYKVYSSIKETKQLILAFTIINNILYSNSYKYFISNIKDDDVIYFYWGVGASYILPFISHLKCRRIMRLHGSDLYFAPSFQKELFRYLSSLVFISEHGAAYWKRKYNLTVDYVVSRLGSEYQGRASRSNDNVFRIISCSFVHPVKNLQLLYFALQCIADKNIEWTHIGSGSLFEDLKILTKTSLHNVKIKLLGYLPNNEIMNYYKNNPVDVFINVSLSEGIPVSIMEAISFDIPVIAPNVGAISEIVNDITGILLSEKPTKEEIATAILEMMSSKEKYLPYEFWKKTFDAEYNYSNFVKHLSNEL